jgi:ubiquinone/menaquinone biosynthesis C-methylase UbiE
MAEHERMFHHHHAQKLDDPERAKWLPAEPIVRRLARPGLAVADVGTGTGYFAIPLAGAVSPGGRVFAVDLQPEMLALLRSRLPPELPITLVAGEATRTTLGEASVELVLLANVWHELDDRAAALAEAARVLRPGGRLAIVDWRTDVADEPGPRPDHRVAASKTVATLTDGGWTIETSEPMGSFHYLVIARRP